MVIDMYGESRYKIKEKRAQAAIKFNKIKSKLLLKEALNKLIFATNDLWRKEEAILQK